MSNTQEEKAMPLINVSIEKKKVLSPERKEKLDRATRVNRGTKVELIFNNAVLVARAGQNRYERIRKGEEAVGILLPYTEVKGLVIDFSDPGRVSLNNVEELATEDVYWFMKETSVTYNSRNKPLIRGRFLLKGEAERTKVDILLSELLTLGWLSYLEKTGNETPEVKEQIQLIKQWEVDRKLIITSTTSPYSLYGLKIMRGKERRKRT